MPKIHTHKRVVKIVFTGGWGSPNGNLSCGRCERDIKVGETYYSISHGDGSAESICGWT